MNRSGRHSCDICDNNEILTKHHISGRKITNPEAFSNLSNICSNCHMKVHEGWISIEGWFMTSKGLKLLWHSKEEESFSGCDATPYLIGS